MQAFNLHLEFLVAGVTLASLLSVQPIVSGTSVRTRLFLPMYCASLRVHCSFSCFSAFTTFYKSQLVLR
jgi:hypothetical protein